MVGLIFTHRMAEGRETSRTIANERPAEAVLDHRFGAIVVVVVVNVSQTRFASGEIIEMETDFLLLFFCFFFLKKKCPKKKLFDEKTEKVKHIG